jgi:hypothetical protein
MRGSAGALSGREAGLGAVGHAAALEPLPSREVGLEPRETWQCRIPPQQGGGGPERWDTWR